MIEISKEEPSKEALESAPPARRNWNVVLKYIAVILAIPLLAKLIASPAFLIFREASPLTSLQIYWRYLFSRDIAISEIMPGEKFCAVGRYDSFQSSDFSNLLGKAEREASDAELTSSDPFVFSANTAIVKVIGPDQKSGAFLSRVFIYGGLLNQEKKGGCIGKNGFIRIEKRNELLYLLIGDKASDPSLTSNTEFPIRPFDSDLKSLSEGVRA